MKLSHHSSNRGAFVLLEALLAVAIFAIGVIALGKCVSNCLAAERIRTEDGLARRALANRAAEIESGAVLPANQSTETLTGPFAGLKLVQTKEPLRRKNEQDQELTGMVRVNLEVRWNSDGEPHAKSLTFYLHEEPRR